jgi:tRNA (guanine-N7-)-methyltransferase
MPIRADSTDDPGQRSIRSYVVRAGRMGPGQVRALADLGPQFLLPFVPAPHDFAASFGRNAPRVLEIGFGMGDATALIAQALVDTDFIGVEVHTPGVGALLKRIGELGLHNLRLIQHDAVEVLEQMVAPASLAGVHVFFPGTRKSTTNAASSKPRWCVCWPAEWPPARPCIAPPTGSPTRGKCWTC